MSGANEVISSADGVMSYRNESVFPGDKLVLARSLPMLEGTLRKERFNLSGGLRHTRMSSRIPEAAL